MKRDIVLRHKFVESLPDALEERTLYVCMEFATVAHKCCCGCEREVVTPLGPTNWKLIYDGRTVSLYPSIGNWSFPCRSHYWIRGNRAQWAPSWSDEQVRVGRMHDRLTKHGYLDVSTDGQAGDLKNEPPKPETEVQSVKLGAWRTIVKWWKGS